jgi:hypothetical protein
MAAGAQAVCSGSKATCVSPTTHKAYEHSERSARAHTATRGGSRASLGSLSSRNASS